MYSCIYSIYHSVKAGLKFISQIYAHHKYFGCKAIVLQNVIRNNIDKVIYLMVSSISLRNKYSNLWSKYIPPLMFSLTAVILPNTRNDWCCLFFYQCLFSLGEGVYNVKITFFWILLSQQLHFVWCNLNPMCKQGNTSEWYWGSILNRSLFRKKNCMWFCLHNYTQFKYGF